MIIKCKMCGGDIEFTPGATYGTCEYCGSTSTIPKADDEGRLNLFNRANSFRRKCEFDKAVAAYEKILEQDDTDAEAHWGAVISRFGIEYVEDPATGKRIPTCHRVQLTSILADEDYKAAVEHAPDAESRRLYEEEAARIAEIQRGILAISQNEKPYDVFICYKETDENGQRTHDSQWAQEVYYGLTEQGYKVFFSRITLEDKLGQEYEPYIFAALNSARVMIVIGSKPEYFNAVWVKNEWSRYLALMANDRKRLLIPCYRGMDPYDLPDELSSLQSQDMSKIGFMQDLLRGVKKVLDAEKKPVQAAPVQPAAAAPEPGEIKPGVSSLMERTALFLEDGDFDSAAQYIDRVLDLDPKHAPAYAAKVCAALGLRHEADLAGTAFLYEDNPDWQKALRFATPQQKAVYEGYAAKVKQRVDRQLRDYAYDCAVELAVNPAAKKYELERELAAYRMTCLTACGQHPDGSRRANAEQNAERLRKAAERGNPGNVSAQQLLTAAEMLEQIGGQEAMEQAENCRKLADSIISVLYNNAVQLMAAAGDSSQKWDVARKSLGVPILDGFRDVNQLREKAAQRFKECLAAEKEAKRKEEEKRREEERRRQEEANRKAAETKRITNIVIALICIVIALVCAYFFVIAPMMKYNDAKALQQAGKYEEAIEAFTELGGYSDAAAQITETKYLQAKALTAAGDYAGAVSIFSGIKGYKDVDSLLTNDHNLAAAAARDEKYSVGNYVTFGHYPQTSGGNDSTEIEWLVLARDGNKALLISQYGLDAKPYNEKFVDITWEKCTLRTWLNGAFLNKAFTVQEQTGILMTNVDNGSSQGYSKWSTSGGNNTQDRIFLLSYAEANKYFGVQHNSVAGSDNNTKSKVAPTAYTIEQGAYTSSSYKTADGSAAGWWWLRSPGYFQYNAALVFYGGSLYSDNVFIASGCVRPALWINLDSGIF